VDWKGVKYHGALTVTGTALKGGRGEAVMLRGMSSHGLQWYSKFARGESIAATKRAGANVFRVAMYTGEGGYLTNPGVTKDVIRAVDDALALDMYAIIDWHNLIDNDPLKYTDRSAEFFGEMSSRYQNEPGVIYEICNEPNGETVTWAGNVKPYAQEIIPVIRANSPGALVLVGSPTWSQDVDIAAADPLGFDNILYTLHFYAGTHGEELREKCRSALAMGAPIFVSEWGTSSADGSGGVFIKQSEVWLSFLEEPGISWCNWSLGDRDETSAALKPGAPQRWNEADLSESGRYVYKRFRGLK
jgi:Endoglucanase